MLLGVLLCHHRLLRHRQLLRHHQLLRLSRHCGLPLHSGHLPRHSGHFSRRSWHLPACLVSQIPPGTSWLGLHTSDPVFTTQVLPAYRCPGLASLAHRDLARTQVTRLSPFRRCPLTGVPALPRDLARTQVTRLSPFGVARSQVSRPCLGLHTINGLSLLRCYPLTGVPVLPASAIQALPAVMFHMFVMFSYVIA